MPKLNTESVLKDVACDVMNQWLVKNGYIIMHYNKKEAEQAVVELGVIITALNYDPKLRKKHQKKYRMTKKLYHAVYDSLRLWEIENCQKVPFENFPSEILRRKVQEAIDEEFRAGFRDIHKYLETIKIKLGFALHKNLNKKKKKRK